jgi:hypothetical protein
MRPGLSSPIAATILLWAIQARANPSARLVYVRGPGASACPEEDAVRRSVSARLGYDPFFLSAPTTIFVEVSRDGERFAAVVKLIDNQGVERGMRHLESHTRACGDLVGTLALTISLVVDPVSLAVAPSPPDADAASPVAPAAPATPPPTLAPVDVPPPAAPPLPAARLPGATRFFAGVTVLGSLGSALAPTAGTAVFGGARRSWASVRVEARADLPAAAPTPPAARSWALFGSAVPCAHWRSAFACAVIGLEWVHATGDLASPRPAETLVTVVGARLGLEVAATESFALAAFAESLVPLQIPRVERSDGATLHTFPSVAGDVGISALERF